MVFGEKEDGAFCSFGGGSEGTVTVQSSIAILQQREYLTLA